MPNSFEINWIPDSQFYIAEYGFFYRCVKEQVYVFVEGLGVWNEIRGAKSEEDVLKLASKIFSTVTLCRRPSESDFEYYYRNEFIRMVEIAVETGTGVGGFPDTPAGTKHRLQMIENALEEYKTNIRIAKGGFRFLEGMAVRIAPCANARKGFKGRIKMASRHGGFCFISGNLVKQGHPSYYVTRTGDPRDGANEGVSYHIGENYLKLA